MSNRSPFIVVLGVFFLAVGVLWLQVIYTRARSTLPAKERAFLAAYKELRADIRETLERPSVMDHYIIETRSPSQPDPLARPAKIYIKSFWIIVLVEVFCCFLYIFAGISLLRLYPFSRFLVFLALYFDALFKGMVMTYMNVYAIPLESVLGSRNILYSYFLSPDQWSSTFSLYVTGLRFYQLKGALFLFVYLVYLFIIFYFFTRPHIKRQLGS